MTVRSAYPTLKTVHGEKVVSKDVLLQKRSPTPQQIARHKFGRKLRGLWLSRKKEEKTLNDSDENQTLGDSFTESDSASPTQQQQDESTLTQQEEEYNDLIRDIQDDFKEEPKEKVIRCNVYVSTQTSKEGKGRVRFSLDGNSQQTGASSASTGWKSSSTSRFPLKSILCNGSETIPTAGCATFEESNKQIESKVEETTNALSSAMEQLTFGDDVMDVIESSQSDMNRMMSEITTETEKSIESCRSFSRKLSKTGDDLMQKVSSDTKSLSENFTGSVGQRSCDVNKLEEVVADHWHKGYFNTEGATGQAPIDKATAAPPSMAQSAATPIQVDDQQCDPSKQVMQFLNSMSTMVSEATKAVQDAANSCDEPSKENVVNGQALSETPLNHSWFSVDQDTDSISKLTNPQDLSTTLNNISLDLTAIPKVDDEKEDEHHFAEF